MIAGAKLTENRLLRYIEGNAHSSDELGSLGSKTAVIAKMATVALWKAVFRTQRPQPIPYLSAAFPKS